MKRSWTQRTRLPRRAGRIAKECREWAAAHIAGRARARVLRDGRRDDPRARRGAPDSCQSSRNSVAAHYCSAPGDELAYEEGTASRSTSACTVDGYVADTAGASDLSATGAGRR